MIKNYNQFNESLRDKMVPVSDDDIKKKLKDQPFYDKALLAAEYGMLDILKDALQTAEGINRKGSLGGELPSIVDKEFIYKILSRLTKTGNVEIMSYLLDKYDFKYYESEIFNLLSNAMDWNYNDMSTFILEKFPTTKVTDNDNWLLRMAVYRGNLDMVKLLLKHGADINDLNKKFAHDERKPIDIARDLGFNDVVEYINKKKKN